MSAAFRARFSLSKKDKPAAVSATAAAGKTVVASPAVDAKESSKGLRGTRRRLSVVSDNRLIEGIATLGLHEESKAADDAHGADHVIKTYAGVSKKVCGGGAGDAQRWGDGGQRELADTRNQTGFSRFRKIPPVSVACRRRTRPCSAPHDGQKTVSTCGGDVCAKETSVLWRSAQLH